MKDFTELHKSGLVKIIPLGNRDYAIEQQVFSVDTKGQTSSEVKEIFKTNAADLKAQIETKDWEISDREAAIAQAEKDIIDMQSTKAGLEDLLAEIASQDEKAKTEETKVKENEEKSNVKNDTDH